MKSLLIATALVLAACSGSNGEPEAEVPAPAKHIALLGADGNIATYDRASGVITPVTDDAEPGRLYSQPTWSPDGSRLAFVASSAPVSGIQASVPPVRVALQAQAETTGSIRIVAATGGETTIIPTPFLPFYMYWSPDGTKLAFLGLDASTGRQAFGVLDVATGSADRIDAGQPYFFAWSPASDRLLIHATNRELYYLALDGTKQALEATPGSFSAPGWIGETQLFPVQEGRRQILRLFDQNGNQRRDATDFGLAIAFGLNPDEERAAYIDIGTGANAFGLGPLVVNSPGGVTEVAELAAAFFWSADGGRLLYLTPDSTGEGFGLRWNVWDGSETIEFERYLPTTTFAQQYLPFFGQYANSLSLFSPDGSSFTFAGTIEGRGQGIWVQDIRRDTPAELVGPGQFSTWAP